MRRWSFAGLLLGSTMVVVILQFLFYLWYRVAGTSGGTFKLLIMLLPSTYLQSFPFGTVMETSWSFLWELPKYLVLFWSTGFIIDFFLSRLEH